MLRTVEDEDIEADVEADAEVDAACSVEVADDEADVEAVIAADIGESSAVTKMMSPSFRTLSKCLILSCIHAPFLYVVGLFD